MSYLARLPIEIEAHIWRYYFSTYVLAHDPDSRQVEDMEGERGDTRGTEADRVHICRVVAGNKKLRCNICVYFTSKEKIKLSP